MARRGTHDLSDLKRGLGHKSPIFFLLDLPGFGGRVSSDQEQKLLHSTRASRGSEKSGISSMIQVRVSRNRHFRLEEVPTGLPRGKRSFLLVLFSILGHENGVWMVLQSSVARLGERRSRWLEVEDDSTPR